MLDCWKVDIQQRPTMERICQTLNEISIFIVDHYKIYQNSTLNRNHPVPKDLRQGAATGLELARPKCIHRDAPHSQVYAVPVRYCSR